MVAAIHTIAPPEASATESRSSIGKVLAATKNARRAEADEWGLDSNPLR